MILSSFVIASGSVLATPVPNSVQWTMLNVNASFLQADAHLIEVPGHRFLIDCGDPTQSLVEALRKRKVEQIEKVFISHLHKDHYGGLKAILESGISVKEVYLTVPPQSVCDAEKPWGCDWEDIQRFLAVLKERHVAVKKYRNNQLLFQEGKIRLETLYAYDGENTPVGKTDVNDTSAILSLMNDKTRVLFTGDLNAKLGEYLAKNAKDLKADILKVPHHSAESVAPNTFLDQVKPVAALVPAPRDLWNGERARRVRTYLKKENILTYVSGIDGNVRVTLSETGFTISAENRKYPLLWTSSLYNK